MSIPKSEQIENPCQYMSQLAHEYLPLDYWGFKESYSSKSDECVIFDSQWCRIKFVWSGWEMYGGNTISIYYGRHHASNNHATLTWAGVECYCWHREELALHLLDVHKPVDVAAMTNSHPIIQEYRQSKLGQSLGNKRRQPEWLMQLMSVVWKQYAPQLFEVFDMRRPDLWDQYQKFLKEVYDIKGRSPNIVPPLDHVC